MKRLLVVVVLVASAWTMGDGPAVASRDIIRDAFPDEQAAVAKVLRQVVEAAEKKELDRLEAFHLYGPKFTKFDDWEPLERQDAAASRKAEREGLAAVKAFSPTIDDLKVDVFGPVAVATFVFKDPDGNMLSLGEHGAA